MAAGTHSRPNPTWRKIRTYHDLDLPPDRPRRFPCQKYAIRKTENYILTNATKTRFGLFTFKGVFQPARDSQPVYQFIHIETNDMVMLSDWQLADLGKDGRVRPIMGPVDSARNIPGASFTVTGKKRDKAERKMAYADAFEQFMEEKGISVISDEEKDEIVKRVASEIDDPKPPQRTSQYKILSICRKGNQFDRLLSFVDNDELKGNRTARYGRALSEMIEEAAQEAVSINGDWKTIRSILVRWVGHGGVYHHLKDLVVDDEGICRIAENKFSRVLGSMNSYVRDCLTFGISYAERRHLRAIRQVRPTAPLAIVDVDHTTLDIVVFDSDLPIAFGRPDLVLFRDRYSGIVIGYAISFASPSYFTFLDGLKHAMFEKDPNKMGGCQYPWFGTPVALGVDNAKHLIGLNIRSAAKQLGFQITA
jgi:putative transposase